jgi:hypothetical protein
MAMETFAWAKAPQRTSPVTLTITRKKKSVPGQDGRARDGPER